MEVGSCRNGDCLWRWKEPRIMFKYRAWTRLPSPYLWRRLWKEPGLVTGVGRRSGGFVLVMLNLKWPIRHHAKTKNEKLEFRGTVRAGHRHSGQNRTKPIKKKTEKATTDLRWTSNYKWIWFVVLVSAKEKAAIGISLNQLYVKEHKVWKSIQSFHCSKELLDEI